MAFEQFNILETMHYKKSSPYDNTNRMHPLYTV